MRSVENDERALLSVSAALGICAKRCVHLGGFAGDIVPDPARTGETVEFRLTDRRDFHRWGLDSEKVFPLFLRCDLHSAQRTEGSVQIQNNVGQDSWESK